LLAIFGKSLQYEAHRAGRDGRSGHHVHDAGLGPRRAARGTCARPTVAAA